MSELQQLKHQLHTLIEEKKSEHILRELKQNIDSFHAATVIEPAPWLEARLAQAEREKAAGLFFTTDQVKARMEARFPYLKPKVE